LLPGALLRNRDLKFICRHTYIRTINNGTIFTGDLEQGEVLRIPVAHGEGNYHAEPDVIAQLHDEGRIVFQYCDADGNVTDEANINGSQFNIAGIVNAKGNVLGMMPHPERACSPLLGSTDGLGIFRSLVRSLEIVSA
jgi:phosphoribosylformylglycinamidine synthase